MTTRRELLRMAAAGGAGALLAAAASPGLFARDATRHPADAAARGIWNVRDPEFGARGDGASDDSTAVQRAIDTAAAAGGGIVYLPPGDYPVAVEVGSGVAVVGAPGTTLRAAGPRSPLRFSGDNTSLRNVQVIGRFRSDTGSTVRSSHCLDVRGSNVLIEGVTSGACRYDSLYIRSSGGGITLRNCRFGPTARNTVSIVQGTDILFDGCTVSQDATYRSGDFSGLYLYDIEPEGASEVSGVAHVRCTFRNGLRDEWAGVVLGATPNQSTGDNRVVFTGCAFLAGPRVATIIRLNVATVYRGLTLTSCRFEGPVFIARGAVTLSRSALVGNEHRSARFAYGVRLDDVALVNAQGGGWTGLSRTARTAVVGAAPPLP